MTTMDSAAAAKISDALTRVVTDALTELAAIKITTPSGEDQQLDFADRIATILTQVAANTGSVPDLLAGRSGSWEADLVRQIIEGTAPHEQLHTWRTTPIHVAPIDGDDLLAEHLAAYDQALTALQEAYSAAWNNAAEASTDPHVIAWRSQHDRGEFDDLLTSGPDDPRWPDFQAWTRQRDAIDPMIDAEPAVAALRRRVDAAEQARAEAITEYEKSFQAAMSQRAHALGYTVDVTISDEPETTRRDWGLTDALEDAAKTATPKPDLTPPTL